VLVRSNSIRRTVKDAISLPPGLATPLEKENGDDRGSGGYAPDG
jgi:hypothetical protein